ncbi:alkaline phosphatase family protein [Mycobacterium uberis]|uniref:alkaline phosphatase family protein n=1 Tax=Mycobacterium uberis TaxID=2162698 RepID=UPI000E30744A
MLIIIKCTIRARTFLVCCLLVDTLAIRKHYFCSLLDGITANRLYLMSATIDPDGFNGGPPLIEPIIQPLFQFNWTLTSENLSVAGSAGKLWQSQYTWLPDHTVFAT